MARARLIDAQTPSQKRNDVIGTFVALGVLGLLSVAFVLVERSVLPVRIDEGPFVQQTRSDGAIIRWFTTREAKVDIVLETNDGERLKPQVERDGSAYRVELSGLEPASFFNYTLTSGGRTLATGRLATAGGRSKAYEFIVVGDTGKGYKHQYRLAERMANRGLVRPNFIVHTGDVIYPDGARHWFDDRFFAPFRKLIHEIPVFPSIGNHDVVSADEALDGPAEYVTAAMRPAPGYRDVFELPENGPAGIPPEHHYWFDYGNARFVVIDSMVSETQLREEVAPWVREIFSKDGPTWRFFVCHHPPFTVGKYDPDTPQSAALREHIVPILEATGVDVVFSGHDHNYQRSKHILAKNVVSPPGEHGIVYVISGAGGAKLYDTPQPEPRYSDLFEATHFNKHSFTRVAISDRRLELEQINIDGEIVDEWVYEKP